MINISRIYQQLEQRIIHDTKGKSTNGAVMVFLTASKSGENTTATTIQALAPLTPWVIANIFVSFKLNQRKWDALCVFIGRLGISCVSIFILLGFLYEPARQKGDSGSVHAARFAVTKVFWAAAGYWYIELVRKLIKEGKNEMARI